MIIYSNSHDISVLVEDTVDLKVKHMDNTFDVEDVKVYIFDDFVFPDKNPHNVKYSFEKMLKKKTDFAGVILESMMSVCSAKRMCGFV